MIAGYYRCPAPPLRRDTIIDVQWCDESGRGFLTYVLALRGVARHFRLHSATQPRRRYWTTFIGQAAR